MMIKVVDSVEVMWIKQKIEMSEHCTEDLHRTENGRISHCYVKVSCKFVKKSFIGFRFFRRRHSLLDIAQSGNKRLQQFKVELASC